MHRNPAPHREYMCFGGEATHNRYYRAGQSLLTQPVLQVVADGVVRLNAVYYFSQSQVAESVWRRDFLGSTRMSEEDYTSSSVEAGPK